MLVTYKCIYVVFMCTMYKYFVGLMVLDIPTFSLCFLFWCGAQKKNKNLQSFAIIALVGLMKLQPSS